MYENYADVLESYLIPAEEGVFDTVKNTYKTVKNSKGGKIVSKTAKGIGTAYALYSAADGINHLIRNKMSSSKALEIERYIKYKLLQKYCLFGKFILVSDFSDANSTICALVSKNNLNDDGEKRLHGLLSELKKNYKFLKYRIGSTVDYNVAVRIYY